MKHPILSLAGVAAITSAAIPAAAQNADLAAVQSHLRAVQSMTAAFAQTDRNGRVLNGTVSLKRPGKVRFQYQPGVPILLVGDGSALWYIDYSVKQVSRWPIGNTPLGILLDPNRDLSRIARILPSTDTRILIAEARDPRHPEYGTLTLTFARGGGPAGLSLAGWVALDAQGNRTRVQLSGQRYNIAIGDQTFAWRDPRPAGPRR